MGVSFGSTHDPTGDITLSRAGKPRPTVDLLRREFLVRFCQGAGASLIPTSLWGLTFPEFRSLAPPDILPANAGFQLRPHYRTGRPLDATLAKVQTGLDEFISEKYADQIDAILAGWSASLLRSPHATDAVAKAMAADFSGAALLPAESRVVRSGPMLEVRQKKYSRQTGLNRDAFLRELAASLSVFSSIITAEFQITGIDLSGADASSPLPSRVETRVRYEIVGTGADFHREQRVGYWDLEWDPAPTD